MKKLSLAILLSTAACTPQDLKAGAEEKPEIRTDIITACVNPPLKYPGLHCSEIGPGFNPQYDIQLCTTGDRISDMRIAGLMSADLKTLAGMRDEATPRISASYQEGYGKYYNGIPDANFQDDDIVQGIIVVDTTPTQVTLSNYCQKEGDAQ